MGVTGITSSGGTPRWRTWSAGRRAVALGLVAAAGLAALGIAFVELPGMVVDQRSDSLARCL